MRFVGLFKRNANCSMLITLVSTSNFAFNQSFRYIMNKEPILLAFGQRIQKLKKERNLSREQLADLAGVHRTYLGMIERAEKDITLCNIERIAKTLHRLTFLSVRKGERGSVPGFPWCSPSATGGIDGCRSGRLCRPDGQVPI